MKAVIADTHSPGPELQAILIHVAHRANEDVRALPDHADERIHDIRVGMKTFRALLELAAGTISPKALKRADRLAKSLKDHFSSSRDNDVLSSLLTDLLGQEDAQATAHAIGIEHAESAIPEPADPLAHQLADSLEKFASGLDLAKVTEASLREAWLDSYRAARREMKYCAEHASDDHRFHEWRKRVKELLYQSSALPFIPETGTVKPDAQELSTTLGAHHDLAVLGELLSKSLGGSRALSLVRARKRDLATKALLVGSALLSTKPSLLSAH